MDRQGRTCDLDERGDGTDLGVGGLFDCTASSLHAGAILGVSMTSELITARDIAIRNGLGASVYDEYLLLYLQIFQKS